MSTTSPQPEKKTLTDQLRARTASIIDPIVTFLARLGVSPDLLTILGMLLHFFFAWLIATGEFFWAGIHIRFCTLRCPRWLIGQENRSKRQFWRISRLDF